MSDKRCGSGFIALLNSPVGRAYFDNNKEEERKSVQDLSKLIIACFLARPVCYVS